MIFAQKIYPLQIRYHCDYLMLYIHNQYQMQKSNQQQQHQSNLAPVYLNRQCYFYANSGFKIQVLLAYFKNSMLEKSSKLYHQCRSCQTNKCLDNAQKRLEKLTASRKLIEQQIHQVQKEMSISQASCRDLIFQNDIRLCRVQVQKIYLQKFVQIINKSNFQSI